MAAESLAARLGELAGELPPQERALLEATLIRAMNPVEQLRHLDATKLLTGEERAVLAELDAREKAATDHSTNQGSAG